MGKTTVNVPISTDEKLELMEEQTKAVKKGNKKPTFGELIRGGFFSKRDNSQKQSKND